MRLVGVPEVRREIREPGRRPPSQPADGLLETQDPCGHLRSQPELGAEPFGQMPPAPPDLCRQLLYPDAARRLAQPPPGPAELGSRLGRGLVAPVLQQQALNQVEPLVPARLR